MKSLIEVSPEVLENILFFLPQHLLLNLSLTNFHFYEPCLRRLYKNISVQIDPVLRNELPCTSRQKSDYIELSVTTVSGFKDVNVLKVAHQQLVYAKIKTLINSISVNPRLAEYIERIRINDVFDTKTANALAELLGTLASKSNSLIEIYIANETFRSKLGYHSLKHQFPNLEAVTIDSLDEIESLHEFPHLTDLVIAGTGLTTSLSASAIPILQKLKHLRIRDETAIYNTVSNALWDLHRSHPFRLKNLKTFNVVHSHANYTHGFPYLVFEQLENFQISLGCENPDSCGQSCLELSLSRFEFRHLKRLAIIQNTPYRFNNHKNNEHWDLVVFDFVKSITESSDELFYLSIRHNVPPDGTIDDGYEGNYVRKVKLYTLLLPGLLTSIQRHVVNLALPNFIASLACYEQPMNTFLWNGCKCPHCDVYLTKLDDYLLHHRYYSLEKGVFKDLLTVQMVRSMGEALVARSRYDPNFGDTVSLSAPMRNVTWNFHNNNFSIPFRCLPVKTFEIAEMEDDRVEKSEKLDRFYDAEEQANDCIFLRKEQFMPNYLVVMSHFLNDHIRRMINLNRGDAEDVSIGLAKDENDGDTNLRINKMLLNGIDYNFDHEINGTIFFTNSFDSTQYD